MSYFDILYFDCISDIVDFPFVVRRTLTDWNSLPKSFTVRTESGNLSHQADPQVPATLLRDMTQVLVASRGSLWSRSKTEV